MKKIFLTLALCLLTFAAQAKDFTLYYFHTNMRCSTCRKFETWTTNVAQNLPVKFNVINTDNKENAHYLTDYQLYTKSVVIADDEGHFKNLDKIWDYAGNEQGFTDYVLSEVKTFMKEDAQ